MKTMNGLVLAAMMLGQMGCASLPKMSSLSPIEIDTLPFRARYKQDGQGIDVADMVAQLKEEPDAALYAARSQDMRIVSLIFAAVGGALIGWPLGQSIGGDKKPTWVLAGAGAGAIGLAIPFTIGSLWNIDRAVESHNHRVE